MTVNKLNSDELQTENKQELNNEKQLKQQTKDQIKEQETNLKNHLTSFYNFDNNFLKLKGDVDYLEGSVERLKAKLRQPLAVVGLKIKQLEKMQQTSQLLNKLSHFCEICSNLSNSEDSQFNAKYIKELDQLVLASNMEDLNIVIQSQMMIENKKQKAFDDAGSLLSNGMINQNQVEIVTALNIIYYLNSLHSTISSIYSNMENQIQITIDKLFNFKSSSSGINQFWDSFESVFNSAADQFIKIAILQTVLQKQKAPESNELYIDLIQKHLQHENLVSSLWSSFNNYLFPLIENLKKKNPNLNKFLQENYPKLVNLIYQFLTKLSIQTNYYPDPKVQSPEKLTLMNSFLTYEKDYLSACYQRLIKPVNLAFPANTRDIATRNDIGYLIRLMAKELDTVQLDTNLIIGVTYNIEKSLKIIISRCSGMIIRDSSAYFLPNFTGLVTGSANANTLLRSAPSCTESQTRNAELCLCLGHLYSQIQKALLITEPEAMAEIVPPAIEAILQKMNELIDNILQPLSNRVQEDIEKSFLSLHQSNYRKMHNSKQKDGASQTSIFMVELLAKASWIKVHLWSKFIVGIIDNRMASVIHNLCERIVSLYLRHAGSIVLSNDQSRLIFTSDMTELEFMLNHWLEKAISSKAKSISKPGTKSISIDFNPLKVFRRLIFTDNSKLEETGDLNQLPIQVAIPHLLTRLQPPFTIFQASDLSPQAYNSNLDKLYKEDISGFFQKALKSKTMLQYREKMKDLSKSDQTNNELIFKLIEQFLSV